MKQFDNEKFALQDEELDSIFGGSYQPSGSQPFAVGFLTENFNSTGSGQNPKYAPMQTVGIQYQMGSTNCLCKAQVISASSSRDSGALFGEFTYSVWIITCEADPSQENTILHGVHESCLLENVA